MRILLIANKIPYPPKDGGSIATLNMAMGLSEQGAKVTLLAMNTSKHFFSPKQIPQEIAHSINLQSVFVNTRILPVKLLINLIISKKPYNAVRFINKIFKKKIEVILSQDRYDIVQLEGLYLTPYIKTIRKNSNAKIALRAHNVEHEIWQRLSLQTKNPFKRVYIQILARRVKTMEIEAVAQVDMIVPITEKDGICIKQFSSNLPLHIAPTGLCEQRFIQQNQSPKYPYTLFHIGGLDWTPNQEGLIWFVNECWPAILRKIPEAKFHIAGRNASNSFLTHIIKEGVIYEGEVENAMEFMQDYGILVIPLLSGSGMRIKIVEGMAFGKAIVSTKIGAEGINAIDGKQIFIADTPEKMAEQCISLLKNPKLAKEVGKQANIYAKEHFNINIISHNLLDFYQGIILS